MTYWSSMVSVILYRSDGYIFGTSKSFHEGWPLCTFFRTKELSGKYIYEMFSKTIPLNNNLQGAGVQDYYKINTVGRVSD